MTNLFSFLSSRGKEIFFPKLGILSQSSEAKEKSLNATIGIALDEESKPLTFSSIAQKISLDKQEIFPYAPSQGILSLRSEWQKHLLSVNPSLVNKTISLPLVCCGITHALSIAGFLFVEKNDKIAIPTPYWENYNLIYENTYEGEIVPFPLFKDNKFNVEEIHNFLQSVGTKKILLLNFPNNPTGYTIKRNEAQELVEKIYDAAAIGKKIVVIIDDAYFGLFYEKEVLKESLFASLCDLHENVLAVKVDGATKELFVWGLRIGFITFGIKEEGYEMLEDKAAGAIRATISNASLLSESLVLKTLKDTSFISEKKRCDDLLEQRYLKVKEVLALNKKYEEEFVALPFNSGYFMCIELKRGNAEKVRKILLEKYDTGVIALDNLLRIAFSSVPTEKIPLLFENIYGACKITK